MADERVGTRELDTRKSYSWLKLFQTFLIALDPFKLLMAAAGILATALGWWLISLIYFNMWTEPKTDAAAEREIDDRKNAYVKEGKEEANARVRARADYQVEIDRYDMMRRLAGPGGSYRTMPWFEDRGRNPFLLTSDAVTKNATERRGVVSWLVNNQAPVLIEPLLKFLSPVYGLFSPDANSWVRLYLFAILIWMLLMWAFFGGIITRMAIVQMSGREGGGLRESLRFVKNRYLSYVSSPLVPILLIFAVVAGCMLFGLLHLIPVFGDIVVDGLFWWIPLGAGFVMALLVVGLVGYPLMYTTLSAEGSDTFDALSRSYNYVYESPWAYIWYGFLAILYGAVVVFFVVFMTSLMVYLGKWGVSQTPLTQTFNRSPDYLFIYSPTSFGWRELMLKGSPIEITHDPMKAGVDNEGNRVQQTPGYYYVQPESAQTYMKEYGWWNYAGAGMVSFWLTLLFMLMLGFSYSYFWTASSMIYLLMRKKVDEVETDEIYTEEEDSETPVTAPKLSPASTPATPSAPTSFPIDAPTLRVSPAPTPAPAPVPPPPPPVPPPAPIEVPFEPAVVPPSDSSPSTGESPTADATPASPSSEKPPEAPPPVAP